MNPDVNAAISTAEQHRCAAMLSNNIAALDALLDPRLSFAHATGVVDDKAAYLAKMAAGRIAYIAIDWPETKVTALGDDHGLLTGRMATHVSVEGVEKQLDNRVTMVWARGDSGWRLLSFQSTPMKL